MLAISLTALCSAVVAEEKAGSETVNTCVSCHRDLGGKMAEAVVLWEKSYHHQMGNNCEGCHGGDPTDLAEAMDTKVEWIEEPRGVLDPGGRVSG